jgi:zinc protease
MTGVIRPGAAGDAVRRVVLANGLTVLVRRDTSAPVCTIVTHVRSGYFDEVDDVSGIAHVLEHMYFKGTPARGPGDIARDTKRVGGYLNAGTIYDYTMYYAVLPAAGFATGLAVQADAYANSLIDAEELRRELEVIIEEERRKQDTPTAVATEGCFALLHDRHRMRRWRIGHPAVLRGFTDTAVRAFYRAHYVPSNTILSIVGDLDPDIVVRAVEQHYGALPSGAVVRDRGPQEPEHAGLRYRDLARDVAQSHLVLGWRGVPPTDTDAAGLDVAAALLGSGRASRLYREVRERSLASSVSAYHYAPTDLGVFLTTLESPPERAADALLATWSQVRGLAAHAPSLGELARVHRGIESRWWRRVESMEGQATYLAAWEALGGWERGAQYLDQQLAVTPEAVRAVVERRLTRERLAVLSLRPTEAAPLAESVEALAARLERVGAAPTVVRGGTPISSPALVGLGLGPERVEAAVEVYRTDGGIPILVRRKAGAAIAHVQALFRGGITDEPEADAGRTTLMVRAALQGTATRTSAQLAEDLESVGGAFGHAVGGDAFGWSVSAPITVLPAALAILADVVESPAFDSATLDTERHVALAALAQLRDDMHRQPMRLAQHGAFGTHPYARPTVGTDAGLAAADTAALRRWHEHHVRRGDGVIVVVADMAPDEVAALVRGAFRSLTWHAAAPTEVPAWPREITEVADARDKAQTALALLLPAPRRDAPLRHAAALLGTITSGLGGRFFTTLRDQESLAYTVHVGVRAARLAGWFASYLACAPTKEAQARTGLLREWQRLAETPVDADELARAQAYAIGSLSIRQQSAASVMSDIADAWLAGHLSELLDEPRALAAVTAADVRTVAAQALASPAVWGVVRGTAP